MSAASPAPATAVFGQRAAPSSPSSTTTRSQIRPGSNRSPPTTRIRRSSGPGGAVLPVWERRPAWFPEEFAWVVGCTYRGLPTRRSAVRNLIGCNMSFRREVFEQLGGFTTRLGRVGSKPLGGEETELCIRIGKHAPGRTVLYDPETSVHHRVPRERSTLRYFLSRCYSEGVSKAVLARLAGTDSGLSSERSYALRTLPSGVWAELKSADPRR